MAKARSKPTAGKAPAMRTAGPSGRGAGAKPRTPSQIVKALDAIDREVLAAVARRGELLTELAKRRDTGLVDRVAQESRRIRDLVARDATAESIAADQRIDLLRHLSGICLQSLHELRVAYLGPQHSYSHLAAIKFFGEGVNLAPVASIPAVFDAVSRRDAGCGVVPVENSTDGRVVDTLGMFVRKRMEICGEVLLPIHHQLLSRTPRDRITEVYSKPQALSQCRGWLASQLPQAKLVEISSTAAAARLAADKPGAAAVASLEAGREYDLDVIDADIEDNPNNVTRFAVLGRERPAPTGDDKTAVLFQVAHRPGALAEAMRVFQKQGLNLTWIESFPKPEKPNEYLFFIELSGHRDEPEVQTALARLQRHTERIEVLGSYPRATLGPTPARPSRPSAAGREA